MSILQPQDKTPEFKPSVPEPILKQCKDNDVMIYLLNEQSITRQATDWGNDKIIEIIVAINTVNESYSYQRNEIGGLKQQFLEAEKTTLRQESWKEKIKDIGKLVALILALITLVETCKKLLLTQ